MGKIIIVGLGNMGFAHLNSFIQGKCKNNIYIIEKDKKRINKVKKILIKEKIKNFWLSHKYPKNEVFDFAVISTKSRERLKVIEKLFLKNKVKILFLEKFIFCEVKNYIKLRKLLKNKINQIYVNVWSEIFLKLLNIKKNNKTFLINIVIPEKKILTNLIHYYEIFRILSGEKFNMKLDKLVLHKKKDLYHEGTGEIEFNKNNSKMIIKTRKMKNTFFFNYHSNSLLKKVTYKEGNIIDLLNKGKKIKFPLASRVTYKFYKKLDNQKFYKNIIFPKYELIEKSSKNILSCLNNYHNKKIYIT